MSEIEQARKQLLTLLNRCDGCQFQNGRPGEKTLTYCEPCINFKAMNDQREKLESLQQRRRLKNAR